MGHTVNFRSYKESYKDKRQKQRPPEDWVIVENTHEAIVDEETWRTAQRCRKVVRRTDTTGEPNPLTGLLYCADCSQRLFNHRRGPSQKISKRTGNIVHESGRSDYCCSNYSGGRGECTVHFISTKTANALILETIKHVSRFARTNEEDFIRLLREQSDLKQAQTAKEYRRKIKKNEKCIAELDSLFRKVYEDRAAEKLSEKRFEQLSAAYESEQAELEEQTARLREALDAFDKDSVRADKFLELVKKHTDFTELSPAMLHEFVEKVVVHEANKSSGRREQQVDIYLNFIGKFDLPAWYEPEQPQPQTTAEQQRAKWREYKRREREREIGLKLAEQGESA